MSFKYHEYINSQEWQEVRKLALLRSRTLPDEIDQIINPKLLSIPT
jgi:hypothetical protein